MAGDTPRARRGLRAGLALLAVLGLVGLGLLPTSMAAFSASTSNPASSFTARATFGLTQTAPCFSYDGSGGCTAATAIAAGRSAVVSPDGKHVYVATSYSPDSIRSGVAEFSRDAVTGALTQIGCLSNGTLAGCTAVPGALNGVQDVAISPDGGTYTPPAPPARRSRRSAATRAPAC